MKKRSILTMFLAIMMSVSIFAGCSQKKKTEEGKTNAVQKKYDINIMHFQQPAPAPDGEVKKLLEEKLGGHKLNVTIANNLDEYRQKLNLLYAAQEMPDVFTAFNDKVLLKGAAATLTDGEFKTYMPDFYAAAMKQYAAAGITKESVYERFTFDGKLKAITAGQPETTFPYGITIRKDKLDELGLGMPKTIDDWEAFFKAYKQKYPNKYPITARGKDLINQSFYMFISAYGTSVDRWHLKDNKLIWGPFMPEMREALALLQKWYKAGFINPEWITMDNKALQNEFLNGNVPYRQYMSMDTVINPPFNPGSDDEKILAADPKFKLEWAPFPTAKPGVKPAVYSYDLIVNAQSFGKQLDNDKDKLHTVMNVINKLYANKDIWQLWRYGEEGKHFDMKDGVPVLKAEYNNNEAKGKIGIQFNMGTMGQIWEDLSLKYKTKNFQNNVKTLDMDPKGLYGTNNVEWALNRVNGPLTSPSDENLDTKGKTKGEEWNKVFAEVVIGRKSLEDFDKFIAEWKKEVGDAQTEAANRLYLKQWLK